MRRARGAAAVLAACLLAGGCVSSVLPAADGIDRSIVTGSVAAPAPATADPDGASDQASIRNAVSSADLAAIGGSSIPWANPVTGSRGEISGVREFRAGASLCRGFTATRESYSGVSLHSGEACLEPGGAWRMRSFGAG